MTPRELPLERCYRYEIVSFRDPVLQGQPNREGLEQAACTCLRSGLAASRTEEASPPQRGIRTEQPSGATRQPSGEADRRRSDQYSIRVNDQFRICFVWTDGGADDVEITDYH